MFSFFLFLKMCVTWCLDEKQKRASHGACGVILFILWGVTLALDGRKCTHIYRKSLGFLRPHQLSPFDLHLEKWIINFYKSHQSKVMDCPEDQWERNPSLRLRIRAFRACGEIKHKSLWVQTADIVIVYQPSDRSYKLTGFSWFWFVWTVVITISNVATTVYYHLPLRFTHHSAWFGDVIEASLVLRCISGHLFLSHCLKEKAEIRS